MVSNSLETPGSMPKDSDPEDLTDADGASPLQFPTEDFALV